MGGMTQKKSFESLIFIVVPFALRLIDAYYLRII